MTALVRRDEGPLTLSDRSRARGMIKGWSLGWLLCLGTCPKRLRALERGRTSCLGNCSDWGEMGFGKDGL